MCVFVVLVKARHTLSEMLKPQLSNFSIVGLVVPHVELVRNVLILYGLLNAIFRKVACHAQIQLD